MFGYSNVKPPSIMSFVVFNFVKMDVQCHGSRVARAHIIIFLRSCTDIVFAFCDEKFFPSVALGSGSFTFSGSRKKRKN